MYHLMKQRWILFNAFISNTEHYNLMMQTYNDAQNILLGMIVHEYLSYCSSPVVSGGFTIFNSLNYNVSMLQSLSLYFLSEESWLTILWHCAKLSHNEMKCKYLYRTWINIPIYHKNRRESYHIKTKIPQTVLNSFRWKLLELSDERKLSTRKKTFNNVKHCQVICLRFWDLKSRHSA